MFESRRRRRRTSTAPLRVTSLNPVRDAKTIGHDVATSRTVIDAQRTALQQRYRALLADAATAEGDDDRELRLETLLVHVGWACEAITDDLTALAKMHEDVARRDELARTVSDEIIVLADLSSDGLEMPETWVEALAELRRVAERLIETPRCTAAQLAELDLVLERIDHAEGLASDAVRTFLGYATD